MIYLERHDQEENIHRFYMMGLSRDLFGAWVLDRRWGRVGCKGGQKRVESYKEEGEAVQVQAKLYKQKRARGYLAR